MSLEETAVVPIVRQYPHVEAIPDWSTQLTIRLLWDRVHGLQEALTAAQSTIGTLVSTVNTQADQVTAVERQASVALALGTRAGGGSAADAGTPVPLPGGGDGGAMQTGVAAGIPTGHDTGGLLSAIRAGQIVGGVGNEYAALRNPTVDLATREAQATALLLRCIWHLRLAGFSAGRQRNPSGVLSPDKLCVVVDGVLRAYDCFAGRLTYTAVMAMQAVEVAPPDMVDDAGLGD